MRYRVSFLSEDEEERMKASLPYGIFVEYVVDTSTPNEAIEFSRNDFSKENPDLSADDYFISVSWSKNDE